MHDGGCNQVMNWVFVYNIVALLVIWSMLALHTPTARALFARPNLLRRAVPTSS
jgi:hypothetical protein